jgi:hypothetical protein
VAAVEELVASPIGWEGAERQGESTDGERTLLRVQSLKWRVAQSFRFTVKREEGPFAA